MLDINVIGLPGAQGSKRHVGGGRMVEMSKTLPAWRDSVTWTAAGEWHGAPPMDGPLALFVEFRFPMPASRSKTVRLRGMARKVTAPDLDKLVRAVGDALTAAGVIRDDARIAHIVATKVEVVGWTGASIRVEEMP